MSDKKVIETNFDNVVLKITQGNIKKSDDMHECYALRPAVKVKAKDLAEWCKKNGYDSVEAQIAISDKSKKVDASK